jgi:hypothetical protein
MTWEPIETAPKDGELIIAGSYFWMAPAYWNGMAWAMSGVLFKGTWSAGGMVPTHWHPLPDFVERGNE